MSAASPRTNAHHRRRKTKPVHTDSDRDTDRDSRQSSRAASRTPDADGMPRGPRAQTTSLESIAISPRTPRPPHAPPNGAQGWNADDAESANGADEVEMSLLGEDERREAADGLTLEEEQEYLSPEKRPTSAKDKRAIALLIVLCASCLSSSPVSCADHGPQTLFKVSQYVFRVCECRAHSCSPLCVRTHS